MSTPLFVACVLAAAGCGQDAMPPDALVGLCTDQRPLAPTFTSVQMVLSGVCVTCHTTGVALDLRAAVSYGNLVDKAAPSYVDPPTDESCGGLLVKPGDPAASYLYQKVSASRPCAGSQMPLDDIGVPSPLIPCEQAVIHDWIAAGAPND